MRGIKILTPPWRYKKSIWYLLKKGGIKIVIDFLLVKYCIPDEGGEYSILNPLLTKFPFAIKDVLFANTLIGRRKAKDTILRSLK